MIIEKCHKKFNHFLLNKKLVVKLVKTLTKTKNTNFRASGRMNFFECPARLFDLRCLFNYNSNIANVLTYFSFVNTPSFIINSNDDVDGDDDDDNNGNRVVVMSWKSEIWEKNHLFPYFWFLCYHLILLLSLLLVLLLLLSLYIVFTIIILIYCK